MNERNRSKEAFRLLVALTGVLLIAIGGCGSDDQAAGSGSACMMGGIVTSLGGPGSYEGGTYIMYIDVDPDPDNRNHLKEFVGVFPEHQLHYNVDVSDVPAGTYYLHMTMDLGQGAFHVGYYGGDPNPWDIPPAANAEVRCGAVLDFNIFD
jgi:hypothetical protein